MAITERVSALEQQADVLARAADRHDEQINGMGGVVAAVKALTEEVKSMKRAMWTVGGGVVLSAVGFAFAVLQQGAG